VAFATEKKLLNRPIALFDIYEGAQIRGGYKSVAYSLVFRAKDRNLEEADISGAMDKILKALEK
jgi:phenylalanyl-tRNA synthetase beta chain